MSPKPVKSLVSLKSHTFGLAAHYQWEKEVLVDYIVYRIGHVEEDILEHAKTRGIGGTSAYEELCRIARAIRRHPNKGLHAQIELEGEFRDLRDFVAWTKEELADYLLYQITALDLGSVIPENRNMASEIHSLAFAITSAQDYEGLRDAEDEAGRSRELMRDLREHVDAKPHVAHCRKPAAPNAPGAATAASTAA